MRAILHWLLDRHHYVPARARQPRWLVCIAISGDSDRVIESEIDGLFDFLWQGGLVTYEVWKYQPI